MRGNLSACRPRRKRSWGVRTLLGGLAKDHQRTATKLKLASGIDGSASNLHVRGVDDRLPVRPPFGGGQNKCHRRVVGVHKNQQGVSDHALTVFIERGDGIASEQETETSGEGSLP